MLLSILIEVKWARGAKGNNHHRHHRSLLSSRRMGPLILFLQATLSLAATSACLQVLNPRCSLSLFTVLRHVSLGRTFLRLPSGAHVSAILGFLSDGILKTWPNHFQSLVLTCSSIVLVPDLSLISSLLIFIGQ